MGSGSDPELLTAVGDKLFFVANDGTTGRELWMSDGTTGGTALVKDIRPGGSSSPALLTIVNGTLFFTAADATGDVELWTSDGTTEGTVRVMDINPSGSSDPTYLTNIDGKLYFGADDGTHGVELWRHDPGAASTVLVKDINDGPGSSYPGYFQSMVNLGGILLFSAFDDDNGFELWRSDGSEGGTTLVKDVRSGAASSFPFVMTSVGGTLYFTATDGATGFELWKSNGTGGGTTLVKDINATPGVGSGPDALMNVNGTLYFRANDGTNGNELWTSDGSESGTQMVLDIHPAGSSTPQYLTNVNGTLYFRATQPATGTELWKSNGGGTAPAADIAPLAASSNPHSLANIGGSLFFAAENTAGNVEPWVARAAASVAQTHLFYNGSVFDGDTPGADQADDSAIAVDKTAYLPSPLNATFANVSSYWRGINGLMIDLAGEHVPPAAGDFTFEVGYINGPQSWLQAPSPTSISVRAGAGLSGSDRVTLIWADGAIGNTWLKVTVKANLNTNLAADYTFLFGNAVGETGIGNIPEALLIDASDQVATRWNQGIAFLVTNVFDFDRDGLVNATDEILTRDNQGYLPLLSSGAPPASVVGRHLFYNNSVFDGHTPGTDPADDNAIAVDKAAYLPGNGLATLLSVTSYVRGINGVMVDLSGSHPGMTLADFTFRVGQDNAPGSWAAAPNPTTMQLRPGEGASGSDRVVLIWADGDIRDTWLEVTLAANGNTGLASPDVFYFGSRTGDTGSDANPLVAITDATDTVETRNNQGVAFAITNAYDFDRDGFVNATDELIARFNAGFTALINIAAPPEASQAAGAGSDPDRQAWAFAAALANVDAETIDDELLDALLSGLG
jgi:ELWxxDGT repeat protein